MATLYFKIGADYDKVIRLRDEIKKLENQLKSFGKSTPDAEIRRTEKQLASSRQEFTRLAAEAAKAGAVMKDGLKKKIDSVTKSSDELSAEIIKQRAIIRETKEDVRMLSEQYSKLGKYSPQSAATLAQLNKAKAALNEQKYALGELQGQQASNRLELRQLTRQYREFSEETNKATVTVDALMSSLKRTAAEIGGLAAIRKFGSDVMNATGTMQQLHVALSTILQDGDKASKLIGEITQFAAKTPFNLEDVASGAKQLLAYGSSAETVVDELSMLGDVAAGLQIPIGQLIYLYGTLRTQGRAMTVDIRQFAGRGIPIYEELAKVLGVTKDQVGELVTDGKVGFKEVEQAFKNMTSEGGKFNDLMENSAGTWPQRMSNIQDTLFQKLNDFGNKYREVFEFGIGTTEELVEHLDDVISVIGGLIAAYGTYKAALIATAVAQKAVGFVESIRLIMSYRKQLGLATAAQQAFNLAAKSNVYVALLSVLVGLGTAIYMFTKRTKEATAAHEALSNVNKKADEEFSTQAATIDRLNGVLKSETSSLEQKKKALDELQNIIPNYNAKLDEEGKLINNNTEAIKEYLVQLEKQIRLKAAQEELEELYRNKRLQEKNVQTQQANYDRTRKQNPIGVVYGGDAGIEAQRQSLNRIAEAEKSLKDANDELKDTQTQIAAIEKEIEQTSLASSKAKKPMSSLSNEIKNVSEKIKKLQKEISGLRSGKIKADAGKTVESTIEAKNKELKAAKESLETLTGKSDKAAAKEENERKKEAEKRKKAQDELDKALLALQQQNQDDKIALLQEGTQKRLAEIDNDYKKRIVEIDKQEAEFKKKNQEAGVTGLISGLTSEQSNELKKARDNATKKQKQDTEKALKEERELHEQSWRNYLKEYGDYQQMREAITEDYNKKIADATKEGDEGLAKSLSLQLESALGELDFSEFQKAINWDAVFGDLSALPSSALSTLRSQLEAVRGSLSGKGGLSADDTEQLKTLTEAIGRIQSAEVSNNPFATLKQGASEYARSLKELNDAQMVFDKVSSQSYDGAQTLAEAFDEALKSQDGVKMAAVENTEVTIEQTDEFGNVTSVTMKYIDALKQLQKAQNTVTTSSSKLGQSINGIGSKMGQIASIGQNATELLSSLGMDVPDSIGKALGGLGEMGAAMEAFDPTKPGSFLNVNNYINFAKGVVGAFEGIGEAIGGIFGLGGADYSEYYDMKDKYDQLSEVWDELIAKKKEYIDIDYGIEAQKAGTEALELLSQQEAYARRVAEAAAGAGASVGSHSIAYRQNRDLGGYLDEVRQYTKQQNEALTQTLMNASADELSAIKENMYDMWMGLDSDFRSALDDIISIKEQSEEIRENMNEAFTGTSFDSFYGNYVDMLADLDNDNLDFAENFEEYMKKSILSSLVANNYRSRIRKLYDDWAAANEDGNIDTSEAAMLREAQKELADEMIADRDSLAETFGWTSDNLQEAGAKGYETISQETGAAIDGRLTAMYSLDIEKKSILDTQVQTLTDIKGLLAAMDVQNRGMVDVATETRSILASSYIELQQISENTGALIEPMRKMQIDIAEVKRNTSRI